MPTWTEDLPEQSTDSSDETRTATSQGQSGVDLDKFVPVDRFAGLQKKAQKVIDENRELKSKIQDLTQEYEGKILEASSAQKQALTKAEKIEKELLEAKQALDGFKHREQVGRVIEEKFPSLARLHSKNLLRTEGLEGEDLESFLREYSETVEQLGTDKRRQQGSGATPPPPAGAPAQKSSDELYAELQRLRPGTEAYDSKFNEYSAALALDSDKLTFD